MISILHIYKELGGIVFTRNMDVFNFTKEKHPEIDIKYVERKRDARIFCRRNGYKLVIYTGYEMIWYGYAVQVFHGISDKKYEENKRVFLYDLLLLSGQKQLAKINNFKKIKDTNRYRIVGYPKLDRIFKGSISYPNAFNNKRKTILYAPTWISQDSRSRFVFSEYGESSLPLWGVKIVRSVAAMKDVNLIIKYHSRVNENATQIYDEIDAVIKEEKAEDRIKVVWSADIVPCMKIADVMISDISAVCYEWFHLDKPIIFANPAPDIYKPSDKPNESTSAWKAGYVINKDEDIIPLLEKALKTDEKREVRNQFLEYAFYKPDGNAGDRQIEEIKKYYAKVCNYSRFRVILHNWRKYLQFLG